DAEGRRTEPDWSGESQAEESAGNRRDRTVIGLVSWRRVVDSQLHSGAASRTRFRDTECFVVETVGGWHFVLPGATPFEFFSRALGTNQEFACGRVRWRSFGATLKRRRGLGQHYH